MKEMERVSNAVNKWADEYMFKSEAHKDVQSGPKVHLLHVNADPLGQIAAAAKMYKGEVVRSLSEVTHAERKYYMEEMQKTKLKMPLETVQFHFMLENVTRAFTHQLVRQRTAAYAQESMRFAVVEDMSEAVALPPSLMGTVSLREWWSREWPMQVFPEDTALPELGQRLEKGWWRNDPKIVMNATKEQIWRFKWDDDVSFTSSTYNDLVNDGMPAEDARGLMPTNIVTRVNYITNLRGLLDHAGNRLCTQAQFEWRLVFAAIASAVRNYQPHAAMIQSTDTGLSDIDENFLEFMDSTDSWQFEAIADLFRPVCYATGKCEFGAEFDRKCSIRPRVQANAKIGRGSDEWSEEYEDEKAMEGAIVAGVGPRSVIVDGATPVFIGAIQHREWLMDPGAAR